MMNAYEEVVKNMNSVAPEKVREFAKRLAGVLATGRRVYVAGNGGSSLTCQHFASDLLHLGFDVVCMVDNIARITAIINDLGWNNLFTKQMARFGAGDALVIFTVHGCVPTDTTGGRANIYATARLCRDRNGELFVFSGNGGGHLTKFFKHNGNFLTIPSGDCDVVEGVHSVLAHMVCAEIKEMIK